MSLVATFAVTAAGAAPPFLIQAYVLRPIALRIEAKLDDDRGWPFKEERASRPAT